MVYKATDLKNLLRKYHKPPEWAIFFEVSDATGARASRYADAVAINLWPSRGLTLRGFEIKVSRSDYKRESQIPEKAEAVARYCDEWWIVSPQGLINTPELELPTAWGLLEAADNKLHITKAAEKTKAAPLDRTFFASLCRAAHKRIVKIEKTSVARSDIQPTLDDAFKRGKAQAAAQAERQIDRRVKDAERKEAKIKEFTKATGLSADALGGMLIRYRVGEAFMAEVGNPTATKGAIRSAQRVLSDIMKTIDKLNDAYMRGMDGR
jgi:hypothetical protein